MTSGIDYAENDFPFGIHVRFYYTNRLEQEILGLRLKERPGTRFAYKSGDALLLTLALKRALGGKDITHYMQERIWDSLGMEADGIWSIDHASDGLEKASCCLAATARDFAKLGRLYLNKGLWEGRRIVPEDWVRGSTRIDTSNGSAWNYQHLWWLIARDRPDFMANGHLGQFLYVNPSAGIIIVRLGRSMGGLNREEWTQVFISLSAGIQRRSGKRHESFRLWVRGPTRRCRGPAASGAPLSTSVPRR
jgi:CubicO group peptidase (beta-lactamase class C family)